MAKTIKATNPSRLRVSYAEAHRVRSLLLSEEAEKLSTRDVQTLLKILNDVYPPREPAAFRRWLPLLTGILIGIGLLLGVLSMF